LPAPIGTRDGQPGDGTAALRTPQRQSTIGRHHHLPVGCLQATGRRGDANHVECSIAVEPVTDRSSMETPAAADGGPSHN
jgi:hypothetical protein